MFGRPAPKLPRTPVVRERQIIAVATAEIIIGNGTARTTSGYFDANGTTTLQLGDSVLDEIDVQFVPAAQGSGQTREYAAGSYASNAWTNNSAGTHLALQFLNSAGAVLAAFGPCRLQPNFHFPADTYTVRAAYNSFKAVANGMPQGVIAGVLVATAKFRNG